MSEAPIHNKRGGQSERFPQKGKGKGWPLPHPTGEVAYSLGRGTQGRGPPLINIVLIRGGRFRKYNYGRVSKYLISSNN